MRSSKFGLTRTTRRRADLTRCGWTGRWERASFVLTAELSTCLTLKREAIAAEEEAVEVVEVVEAVEALRTVEIAVTVEDAAEEEEEEALASALAALAAAVEAVVAPVAASPTVEDVEDLAEDPVEAFHAMEATIEESASREETATRPAAFLLVVDVEDPVVAFHAMEVMREESASREEIATRLVAFRLAVDVENLVKPPLALMKLDKSVRIITRLERRASSRAEEP